MAASLDDLVSMSVFARVVEASSFSAAAERLGISKSVVSTRVSRLERRLGVRLLQRTTRRVVLTPDGARLYERCAQLLSVADEAADLLGSVSTVPEGTVRVAAPVGVAHHPLAALLRAFGVRYRRVQVDLTVTDRPVDMLAEGFDVVVRVGPQAQDRTSIVRKLGVERLVVCGAPRYLEAHPTPRSPQALLQHNCLRLRRGSEWFLRTEAGRIALPISGTLVVDNIAVLREAALEGVGLAWLPASLVEADLQEGRLRALLEAHTPETADVVLTYPQRTNLPRRVRVFIDFVTENFRKHHRGTVATEDVS
jgi:DNA-binding transcriptional LysR family regulator